jgi:hypothetical protein
MTDDRSTDEPVGSVGEEAAKLLQALQGWAKETSPEYVGVTTAAADKLKDINEHIASGGSDCQYCPVCQAISLVRRTSPEVKAHLADAASSLLKAAAGAMATHAAEPGEERPTEPPVEKIDLSDDLDWEDD